MKKSKSISPSKLIFWLLLIIFLWVVIAHFTQTKQIVEVLSSGRWYWIGLAVICQLLYYPYYSALVEYVFGIFNVAISRQKILPIYVASKFTDVALPVATLGQVAVFVRNGKRYGLEPLNVGIGITFVLLLEVAAFTLFGLISLVTLTVYGEPRSYLLATLLLLTVVLLVILLFVIRHLIYQKPLNRMFLWIIHAVTRFARSKTTDMEEVEQIFGEAGRDLRSHGEAMPSALLWAVATHLLNLLTFAFVYLAFAGDLNILAILGGYIACLLFTIVSITPQGIGVAETVMITTLHSFGLDISTAAVITLAYRGLLYWLPFFPGFYVFSRLELRGAAE